MGLGKELVKRGIKVTIITAGKEKLEHDIKQTVNQHGLEARCILLGNLCQNRLPSLYKAADVFLLASTYEIYGMVILEAMYFGVPVVSFLTAGSEILVHKGKNGYIVNDFVAEEWKKRILQVCENKDVHSAMAENAVNMVKSEFVWDKAVKSFLRLYGID